LIVISITIDTWATCFDSYRVSNYFVNIGDPTVRLTALLIGSVLFDGLKMTQ